MGSMTEASSRIKEGIPTDLRSSSHTASFPISIERYNRYIGDRYRNKQMIIYIYIQRYL